MTCKSFEDFSILSTSVLENHNLDHTGVWKCPKELPRTSQNMHNRPPIKGVRWSLRWLRKTGQLMRCVPNDCDNYCQLECRITAGYCVWRTPFKALNRLGDCSEFESLTLLFVNRWTARKCSTAFWTVVNRVWWMHAVRSGRRTVEGIQHSLK